MIVIKLAGQFPPAIGHFHEKGAIAAKGLGGAQNDNLRHRFHPPRRIARRQGNIRNKRIAWIGRIKRDLGAAREPFITAGRAKFAASKGRGGRRRDGEFGDLGGGGSDQAAHQQKGKGQGFQAHGGSSVTEA